MDEEKYYLNTFPKQAIRIFENCGGKISIEVFEFEIDREKLNRYVIQVENENLSIVASALLKAAIERN